MRIDIVAIGSRGDVQPFVALGLGLQGAGHGVRIVTLGGFEDLVLGRGLDHLAIGDSPRAIAGTAAGQGWVKSRSSTAGHLQGFVQVARSRIEEGIARYWQANPDAELLIVSPMGLLAGISMAERLGVPMIRAQVEPPAVATKYGWDGRVSPAAALERGWAVCLDRAFSLVMWNALRGSTNAARKRVLNLPPLRRVPWDRMRVPLLCGYSQAVFPRLPDWGKRIHVTGYWFLDDGAGWAAPRELAQFLEAGPPPVFVGLGSTALPQAEATADLVVRALTQTGDRGIIVAGGTGMPTGRLTDHILSVDAVPYEWLLPHVCMAVHQGGAGVTALVLRHGVPSVTVPVFGVHPVWANRIHQLGAGVEPIPAANLTAENLANGITNARYTAIRTRAAEIGNLIRQEDGVARAIDVIEEYTGAAAQNTMSQHAR